MITTNTQTFSRLNCDTSDAASVRACFPNKEAMVYGFAYCYYIEVESALNRKNVRTYGYSLGADRPDRLRIRFIGRQVYQINSGRKEKNANGVIRECKAGLVNMVLENYRSQREELPLVPIIFCVATPQHPVNANNIVSKTSPPTSNKIMTHCELRRAYKLCHDTNIPPEIRDVAKKSFKFFQVTPIEDSLGRIYDLRLCEIEAPWKSPEWDAAWRVRKSSSTPRPGKQYNWRKEVNDFVRRHNWDAPYWPLFLSKI